MHGETFDLTTCGDRWQDALLLDAAVLGEVWRLQMQIGVAGAVELMGGVYVGITGYCRYLKIQ